MTGPDARLRAAAASSTNWLRRGVIASITGLRFGPAALPKRRDPPCFVRQSLKDFRVRASSSTSLLRKKLMLVPSMRGPDTGCSRLVLVANLKSSVLQIFRMAAASIELTIPRGELITSSNCFRDTNFGLTPGIVITSNRLVAIYSALTLGIPLPNIRSAFLRGINPL